MARIEYAKGIIITLPDDTGNLFVTMSAKALNPKIKTITRANRPENIQKIKRVGANSVICPSSMAGSRMALSMIKPASVAYVQTLVETRHLNLEPEELVLSTNSPLVNVHLKDSGIREKFGTLVLAIKRSDSTIVNPDPKEKLLPGDILIICGSAENLYDLEKLAIG
ncbi:potassium channel family protein [Desulfoscipio gibsoniae]|uniref:potassium channel family protein n=1 Tax=Desulfoscipio gibsoniae TaxID=102134 RepID=UPI000232A7E3|nr:TrkA C-terminal domain-containing protein [Desulfoscipio gibsoniae]